MIARNLDSEIYSSSNYNLIVEDNIQKIISTNNFLEVLLLFQTQFTYLVDKYKKKSMSLKKKPNKALKNIS